jgi:putative ABC transport system substrate-binding protein
MGSAATWPPGAFAQQLVRRIGVLMAFAQDDSAAKPRVAVFQERLRNLGWVIGRNLEIDYRWAAANGDLIRASAKQLVEIHPDVIVGHTTAHTLALLAETRTIPIVFVSVGDPIGSGMVDNFARPNKNASGFTSFEPTLSGKWLALLKEMVPRLAVIALTERYQLPAIYPYHYFAAEGGLASYGTDPVALFSQPASYIDRILRGTPIGELPVQAPTKYDLVINLKSAKALGLEVPPALLARADEVIE